jgi:Carboxypeptidase regulatory-like domain
LRSAFLVGPFFILTLLAATTTGARSAILPRHVIASPYATQLPELTPPEYQPLAIAIAVCPDGPLFTEIIEIPSDDDPTLDFTLEEEFFLDELGRGVYYVLIPELEASAGSLQVAAVQSQESPDSEDGMNQQKVTAQPASTDQVSTQRVPTLEGSASVSGTVLDSRGAVIQGAQVSLTLTDGSRLQTVKSDANGEFTFPRVQAGSYRVAVDAAGFAPFRTEGFVLMAKQVYSVPNISLSIASPTTSVVVHPIELIAAEQIKAEEKQRLLGIFPNFYVSYIPDAAPLTSKQKFSLAAHETFDWTRFAGVSLTAGFEQATNAFSVYGQGAAGYGKRWGAQFANETSSQLLSRYVFASILHQDPCYFYQGTGTKKSRLWHALSNAFVARSDSGKEMPNYSYLLGNIVSGALSNAYYPPANRGAHLVFTNAAIGLASRAGEAVIQEFIGKRLTKNVPNSAPSEKHGIEPGQLAKQRP